MTNLITVDVGSKTYYVNKQYQVFHIVKGVQKELKSGAVYAKAVAKARNRRALLSSKGQLKQR